MTKKRLLSLNAVHLRLLALLFMLLDHLWATVIPGNFWMTCVGRLAFPIFAFQAAEGFRHTSDFKGYCRRLLIFGLISEIPFNLITGGGLIWPFHQNVLFTILLGLIGIRAMDRARQAGTWQQWAKGLAVAAAVSLLGAVTFVDYGYKGVLTVIAFGVLRQIPCAKAAQLITMILLHGVMAQGLVFPVGPVEIPQQTLAIFALIPIWLYNGEKGLRSKALQYASYVFYPAHMLILGIIGRIW